MYVKSDLILHFLQIITRHHQFGCRNSVRLMNPDQLRQRLGNLGTACIKRQFSLRQRDLLPRNGEPSYGSEHSRWDVNKLKGGDVEGVGFIVDRREIRGTFA